MPTLRRTIAEAPDELLRMLFEITQLTVHLPGDYVTAIATALDDPQVNDQAATQTPTARSTAQRVDPVRALGGVPHRPSTGGDSTSTGRLIIEASMELRCSRGLVEN